MEFLDDLTNLGLLGESDFDLASLGPLEESEHHYDGPEALRDPQVPYYAAIPQFDEQAYESLPACPSPPLSPPLSLVFLGEFETNPLVIFT